MKHSIFIVQASMVMRMRSTKQHTYVANRQEDLFKISVFSVL